MSDVPEELTPLLDAKQVAAVFGMHPRTVMRLAVAGEIPSVRISERGLRFRPGDVAAFIEARRTA